VQRVTSNKHNEEKKSKTSSKRGMVVQKLFYHKGDKEVIRERKRGERRKTSKKGTRKEKEREAVYEEGVGRMFRKKEGRRSRTGNEYMCLELAC